MTYRLIDTGIWHDPWFEELAADAKLIYIYLFSSGVVSACGAGQYSRRRISHDTGVPVERVDAALAEMEAAGKIVIEGPWIICRAFVRHQARSGNFAAALAKSIADLPEGRVKTVAVEEAAKKGVLPRHRKAIPTPMQPQCNPDATPMQPQCNPNATPMQPQCNPDATPQQNSTVQVRNVKLASSDAYPTKPPGKTRHPLEVTREWLDGLQSSPAYQGIDVSREVERAKAWLTTRPGRKLTRRFVISWLNRAEPSASRPASSQAEAADPMDATRQELEAMGLRRL